jgi:hypothetical protein
MAFQTAGNDPRHGLIAIAHKYLFAVANELNMGAELSFQIADIDSSHAAIIADVTMLVICYLSSGMRGQRELLRPSRLNPKDLRPNLQLAAFHGGEDSSVAGLSPAY